MGARQPAIVQPGIRESKEAQAQGGETRHREVTQPVEAVQAVNHVQSDAGREILEIVNMETDAVIEVESANFCTVEPAAEQPATCSAVHDPAEVLDREEEPEAKHVAQPE